MDTKKVNLIFALGLSVFSSVFVSSIVLAESIIQKEEMSFEKCLGVIRTSEGKLSTKAEISNAGEQNRIAIFQLSDGTLKIECNGVKELVIVSTNKD